MFLKASAVQPARGASLVPPPFLVLLPTKIEGVAQVVGETRLTVAAVAMRQTRTAKHKFLKHAKTPSLRVGVSRLAEPPTRRSLCPL